MRDCLGILSIFFRMQVRDTVFCHRVVDVRPDGKLVTKGDANEADDLGWLHDGLEPEQMLGLVVLRVPLLGWPVMAVQKTLVGKVAVVKSTRLHTLLHAFLSSVICNFGLAGDDKACP
jgi:hypothetical protein